MALPGLIEALEREARAEADALLEGARSRADRYVRAAEDRLDRIVERTAASREEELRRREERRAARRSRFLWRWLLLEREAGLERILVAARDRLPRALDDDGYRASLGAQLAAALDYAEGPAEVRAPEALLPPIGTALPEGVAAFADPDAGTGFRLLADDGRLVVDATLERRLERLWPGLRIELAAALEESVLEESDEAADVG